MKKITILIFLFALNSTALAGMSPPTSEKASNYFNILNEIDYENQTYVDGEGVMQKLESLHFVIQDTNRPDEFTAEICNIPPGVNINSENKLNYSMDYEHAFRIFIYANTTLELEKDLLAIFMVSPGRFGIHTEKSGTQNLGSYTPEGTWNVRDHDPQTLAGRRTGQYKDYSIFDDYFSKASEDALMDEAIFFHGGIAVHGSGGLVDGNPQSHACVRMRTDEAPQVRKAAILVDANITVTVRDTEVFKHCYDKKMLEETLRIRTGEDELANVLNDIFDAAATPIITQTPSVNVNIWPNLTCASNSANATWRNLQNYNSHCSGTVKNPTSDTPANLRPRARNCNQIHNALVTSSCY